MKYSGIIFDKDGPLIVKNFVESQAYVFDLVLFINLSSPGNRDLMIVTCREQAATDKSISCRLR